MIEGSMLASNTQIQHGPWNFSDFSLKIIFRAMLVAKF